MYAHRPAFATWVLPSLVATALFLHADAANAQLTLDGGDLSPQIATSSGYDFVMSITGASTIRGGTLGVYTSTCTVDVLAHQVSCTGTLEVDGIVANAFMDFDGNTNLASWGVESGHPSVVYEVDDEWAEEILSHVFGLPQGWGAVAFHDNGQWSTFEYVTSWPAVEQSLAALPYGQVATPWIW